MKYLSVCSGIEAASVAWHGLGWEPVAFSEIEPFPSAVLKHHYPNVPNVGDMTKFKEWDIGSIDLLVGGTPCQSFSVAGLRKGLDDPRGNLMLTFGAIARHFSPRWLVWENVPGVLSSNGGRDFGTFLGMLGELGYGFAYRILDAQYFGVAQRRRRVFVVGCLGNWRSAAAVLFELESMSGNPPPSRKKRKETTRGTPLGLGPSGELARALTASNTASGRMDANGDTYVAQPTTEVMSTLLSSTAGISRPGNAATEHETYIPMVQPVTYDLFNVTAPVNRQSRKSGDPCHTLAKANAEHAAVVHPIALQDIRGMKKSQNGKGWSEDGVAYSLDTHATQGVVHPISWDDELNANVDLAGTMLRGGQGGRRDGVMAPTLTASNDPSRSPQSSEVTQQVGAVYQASMAVRRLTPRECERLQGFPDDYTMVPWRKGESPDGPRYKALGNSMAVPVMRWIGQRIRMVNELPK